MTKQQAQVNEFHRRHDYPSSVVPRFVSGSLAKQRADFINEELEEYRQACAACDLVAIADALGDILYVLLGTAVVHGIDLEPIFEEIHRSNMTKTPLDPVTRKGGKGDGYEPPQLEAVLLEQGADLT